MLAGMKLETGADEESVHKEASYPKEHLSFGVWKYLSQIIHVKREMKAREESALLKGTISKRYKLW